VIAEGIWLELVTLGALIWLGYMGARIASRFSLPSVTGFLLVGVAAGPYGLGLLSLELLHKIEFVNTLALGLIVFLIGEELTADMLRRHHWSFWLISVGTVTLPALFVYFAMRALVPDLPEAAWVLGAIAMSGAPATVMSLLAETRASGRSCNMLLGSAAFSDIATVVAYSVVGPLLLLQTGDVSTFAEAGMQELVQVAGGIALGVAFGYVFGMLIRRAGDAGELLSLGLTHVLLIVAAAHLLGVSTLLAPLTMGITVAVLEERRGDRGRCFDALRTVEYPVYIIFFTLAGAELDFTVVFSGGLIMVAYIAARTVGKFLAGFGGSLLSGLSARNAAWFGLGALPQAGVAVGLALSASTDYPQAGPTITAVVLASIVFFEAVGPLAAKRALNELSCAEGTCELEEEGETCRERTVLIPVSHHWSAEKLLHIIEATDDESDCPSVYVLAHVVLPARGYTQAEALSRGQQVLDELADVARAEGRTVDTRIVSARTVDVAIADLADNLDADLVVLGTPAPGSRGLVDTFVRSPLHKIVDRLDSPVFIVPEGWQPRQTSAHISSTVAAGEQPPIGVGEGAEIPAPGPDEGPLLPEPDGAGDSEATAEQP